MEPVKGACGDPDSGHEMRRVGAEPEEHVEGGARQPVSYKYETLPRIKTSNFPI
jgi:hypothetical protein